MADGSHAPIRKAALRRAAPAHITARELIRRYLHEAGQELRAYLYRVADEIVRQMQESKR